MRQAIRDLVAAIAPCDELEQAHLRDTLAWIDSGADLFRTAKPATPPQHLVSYFLVIDGENALLVHHRNAGLWLPSGGHVEPGEHPTETVTREALEELGLEAEFLFDGPVFLTQTETVGTTAGHRDVSLWYVLKGDVTTAYDYDREEFHDIRWFPFAKAPLPQSDPHLGRFLSKLTQLGVAA